MNSKQATYLKNLASKYDKEGNFKKADQIMGMLKIAVQQTTPSSMTMNGVPYDLTTGQPTQAYQQQQTQQTQMSDTKTQLINVLKELLSVNPPQDVIFPVQNALKSLGSAAPTPTAAPTPNVSQQIRIYMQQAIPFIKKVSDMDSNLSILLTPVLSALQAYSPSGQGGTTAGAHDDFILDNVPVHQQAQFRTALNAYEDQAANLIQTQLNQGLPVNMTEVLKQISNDSVGHQSLAFQRVFTGNNNTILRHLQARFPNIPTNGNAGQSASNPNIPTNGNAGQSASNPQMANSGADSGAGVYAPSFFSGGIEGTPTQFQSPSTQLQSPQVMQDGRIYYGGRYYTAT